MILTIKGADFSAANIGTLNTVSIRKVIGRGVVHSIPNFVEKGSSVNWTITLNEDYEFGSYAITMGGEVVNAVVDGSVMTISIANVTGAISISVATTYVGVAEPEQPDMPDTPTPEEPTPDLPEIGDYIDLTSQFVWEIGGNKWSNGSNVSDNNWKRSNKVNISAYKTLKFSAIQTPTEMTSLGYTIYDKNDIYIGGESNSGANYIPIDKEIELPSGAKYIRLMWISDNNENYDETVHNISNFYCYGLVNENNNEPEEPEENLPSGEEVNITDQFISWTPGTITYQNGGVGDTDKNWLYSNAVDVNDFSTIRFMHTQTPNATTSLGYAFYDASDKRVGGNSNAGEGYVPVEKTIEVPSNAKYFRCMWMNTINSNYTSVNDIANFYCYGTYK